jgi:hypothetical protein
MPEPNYKEILEHTLSRISEIIRQKSDLDAEAARLSQLLFATINMVSDEDRIPVLQKWYDLFQKQFSRESTLIDAIRKVLRDASRQWLTVKETRDRLIASGFDFSEYMSNPLASVSSTLVRLKEKKEVEANTVEGVTAYRLKHTRSSRLAKAFANAKPAQMSTEQLLKYADEFTKLKK